MSRKVINVVTKKNDVVYLACSGNFDQAVFAGIAPYVMLCKMSVNSSLQILPYSFRTGSSTPVFYAFAIMPEAKVVYQGATITMFDLLAQAGYLETLQSLPVMTEEEFYSDNI